MEPETREIIAAIDMHLLDAARLFAVLKTRLREEERAQLPSVRSEHDDRVHGGRREADPRHARSSHERREEVASADVDRGPEESGGDAGLTDVQRTGDDRARRDLPAAAQHLSDAWFGDRRVRVVEGVGLGSSARWLDFDELAFGRTFVRIKLDVDGSTMRIPARNVEVYRGD